MGWSFRKSKSFGPFRVNFSKSGIGLSVGVKGARVSFSKRGTYVNLGVNGIYYRQRIDQPNRMGHPTPVPHEPAMPGGTLHTITTSDVEVVTDVDSRAFVDELQEKASKKSFLKWGGVWPSVILFLYALTFADDVVRDEISYQDIFIISRESVHIRKEPTTESPVVLKVKNGERLLIANQDSSEWVAVFRPGTFKDSAFVRADMGNRSRIVDSHTKTRRLHVQPWLKYGYVLLAFLLLSWCFYLRRVDRDRKTLSIYYDLDNEIASLHGKFLQYFREFAASSSIWQNLHATSVSDVKYHGGASTLVSRVPVSRVSFNKLPSPFLKTNISVPCISLRNTELYFFPERLIVKRGNKFGAIFYKNVAVEVTEVNFIESGSVPSDAVIVDHTWKYLNKSGGPDRRFNDNRQLPVCQYSQYSFKSDSGLFEVLTTSKNGAMDHFVEFLKLIGCYQQRLC